MSASRAFPPPPEFVTRAQAQSGIHEAAAADPLAFWASWARRLTWSTPFNTILTWREPIAEWFADGSLNASVNALDRHVAAGHGARVAFFFEGEPGDRRAVTYNELLTEVCRCANGLRRLGIGRGDRVAIYLPMILELPIAMLACARIGAIHSVIFAGFSPEAIADRINDSDCVALITADGGYRRGKILPLKEQSDIALASTPSIRHCIVAQRTGQPIAMHPNRDMTWQELIADTASTCEPEAMHAEDVLFLLYTSGTTAKPKGIMHTTGGYLTGVTATHALVFDHRADEDVYWCAADLGWITGHSYILYGPLANGATSVLYEGAPDAPNRDRWWEIIARYRVSILYTAPTAIRTFMKWGESHPAGHDLSSLRLLGSVGEPINPEAWLWYHTHIGGGRCPIVDTWWQTETGAIAIAPLPGIATALPGSAMTPFPGISVDILDDEGNSVEVGSGALVITQPWPSMLRGIWGDEQRYRETYWSRYPGRYLAGDGCRRDADGNLWLLGRIDDVMNISGHRVSTAEVESALIEDHRVAEAAVIGQDDPITGQSICAFVILRGDVSGSPELAEELRTHVGHRLGRFLIPKEVVFTPELPKTRSGKIMRRLLRDLIGGKRLGDTTTLADQTIMHDLEQRTQRR